MSLLSINILLLYLFMIFFNIATADETYALTSGPTQPEFTPWSSTTRDDMVDLFSGDFQYSIPLMDVPGPNGNYPIVLSYRSGIAMDQEASWVGLGWTLNPGTINRQVRGLPDDFDGSTMRECGHEFCGDYIANIYDMKPSMTIGTSGGLGYKLFGGDTAKGIAELGLTRYFNNYRGFGWLASLGIKGQMSYGEGNLRSVGGRLGISYDTQQGTNYNVSASLSLTDTIDAGLAFDVNTIDGLNSLSLNASYYKNSPCKIFAGKTDKSYRGGGSSQLFSFSGYASPSYIPDSGYDTSGTNIDLYIKTGPEFQGSFPYLSFSGFYTEQEIKNKGQIKYSKPYGYMNLERGGNDAVLDYYRENDGPVWDHTPMLSSPILTHDLYVVSGGGANGTFRAYKNDVPILFNPEHHTDANGYTIGFDFGGGGISRLNIAGTYSSINTTSGRWTDHNNIADAFNYIRSESDENSGIEKVYFKFIGEPTKNIDMFSGTSSVGTPALGYEEPMRVKLTKDWEVSSFGVPYRTTVANAELRTKSGTDISLQSPDNNPLIPYKYAQGANGAKHIPRAITVQPLTNSDLRIYKEAFSGFIDYRKLNEQILADHPTHIGAFIITDADGKRYIYGIAVYNLRQSEYSFSSTESNILGQRDDHGNVCSVSSVNYMDYRGAVYSTASDNYLHVKHVSKYVHSYLLTAIIGPDYVDLDSTPGPSDGDIGYWVKFNYEKQKDASGNDVIYKWRAPYSGAKFVKGLEKTSDDKATFTYGEREVWYLKNIETKTHIAEFDALSNNANKRKDGRGADRITQDDSSLGAQSYWLSAIRLSSKPSNNIKIKSLIKSAIFTHTYDLAKKAQNASDGVGKLTLTKIEITNQQSERGKRSPYTFKYSEVNPDYSTINQDWWGNYTEKKDCQGLFPYSQQPQSAGPTLISTSTNSINMNAAAWHLTEIQEPSGARLTIEYESKQYRYVQDKDALRLYPIVRSDLSSTSAELNINNSSLIYFPLADQPADLNDFRTKYGLTTSDQIYFKIKSRLKSAPEYWAFVRGYAEVEDSGFCDGVSTAQCSSGQRSIGWVKLKSVDSRHPFLVAAWEHLRLQEPDKIHNTGDEILIDPNASIEDKAFTAYTLASQLGITEIASSLYDEWLNRNYGNAIRISESWIRLKIPSKNKYGGGSRVRQIVVNDSWCESTTSSGSCSDRTGGNSDHSSEYGWVYEYVNEDGMSSGVAANEPSYGGEENPLRTAALYSDKHWYRTDHNLFYEGPANAGYFPAPSVGYSRVVVHSIASKRAREELERRCASANRTECLAPRPSAAGPTAYEFFTAHDYPTYVDHTGIQRGSFYAPIPIPFIGSIMLHTKGNSQGQAIILNDMHGREKRISHYQLSPNLVPIWDAPVSSVEYKYADSVDGINSLSSVNMQSLQSGAMKLGRTEELFLDMRSHRSVSQSIGLDVGVDLVYAVIPVPVAIPWPTMTYAVQEVKTSVVNKVIHKSHMLTETVRHDRDAVTTEVNKAFDALSGKAVISSKGNNFAAPVYDFNIPAFWVYRGMGSGYNKLSMTFNAPVRCPGTDASTVIVHQQNVPSNYRNLITPGDEFVFSLESNNARQGSRRAARVVATEVNSDYYRFKVLSVKSRDCSFCHQLMSDGTAAFSLLRPSERNLINQNAGSIKALINPLDYQEKSCTVNRSVPCENTKGSQKLVSPTAQTVFNIIAASLKDDKRKTKGKRNRKDVQEEFLIHIVDTSRVKLTRTDSPYASACYVSLIDKTGKRINPKNIKGISNVEIYSGSKALLPTSARSQFTGLQSQVELSDRAKIHDAYIISDCPSHYFVKGIDYAENKSCIVPQVEYYAVLDQVVDAAAEVFADSWYHSPDEYRLNEDGMGSYDEFNLLMPYQNGISGIWHPKRNVSYFEERRLSTPLNLGIDGSFDGVAMFDWGMSPSDSCVNRDKWREVRETTRYSPYGYEVEERNILNVFASALYGYKSSVPIAVSHNARNDEIGYEGFEEFVEPVLSEQHKSGNIDFFSKPDKSIEQASIVNYAFPARITMNYARLLPSYARRFSLEPRRNATPLPLDENYLIHRKMGVPMETKRAASDSQIGIRLPVGQKDINYHHFDALLMDKGFLDRGRIYIVPGEHCFPVIRAGSGFRFEADKDRYDPFNNLLWFSSNTFGLGGADDGPGPKVPDSYRDCLGFVDVVIPGEGGVVPPPIPAAAVRIRTGKAHTGTKSLQVNQPVQFEQNHLNLAPGKKYLLSAWVSRDNIDVVSYVSSTSSGADSLGIHVIANSSGQAVEQELQSPGPVIEGWQQYQKIFAAPEGHIILEFVNGLGDTGQLRSAYFDDVRIQPIDASLQTYVYNPLNYRTVATLDENNFAQFYHYDEEGALYLINRETIRGIQSLQEGRSHLRER